jgi:acetolactate synthase-1/2/3 large subunit
VALDAVYGMPLDGVDVVEVPGDLAELFAAAHARVTGRTAGAHPGDGRIVTPETASTTPAATAPVDEAVARLEAAAHPIVLAGPGVVRDAAVDGLRAFAAAGSIGVLNTWGAKGVFEWTNPHHLATAGLQARDFELGGLADADLIVATGIDEAEARAGWRLASVVEVAPPDLQALAARWSRPSQPIAVPPLRTEVARVTQEGWRAVDGPLPPSRVTLAYSEALGATGLVVADPGAAGYWVARTFPTRAIGGAIVPAVAGRPGFAAACAIVARRQHPDRQVLAVVDGAKADGAAIGAVDPVTARVLEAAAALGVTVAVEVWSSDGVALDAAAHERRLHELLDAGGVGTLRTDPEQLDRMVEVAGPVVAWGGLPVAGPPVGQPG